MSGYVIMWKMEGSWRWCSGGNAFPRVGQMPPLIFKTIEAAQEHAEAGDIVVTLEEAEALAAAVHICVAPCVMRA